MPILQKAAENLLLKRMAPADFQRLEPHLVQMDLSQGTILQKPGQRFEHAHFLRTGIASVIAGKSRELEVDLGQVGHEGVCGRSHSMHITDIAVRVELRISGKSWAFQADEFRIAVEERPGIARLLMQFFYTFHLQMSDTLLTTARFTIIQRLARLLLMFQDRVGSEVQITHDQIAQILAVRRAGVTQALQLLEGKHMLRSVRGSVRILDRPQLLEIAEETYGGPEAAYDRFIPPHET